MKCGDVGRNSPTAWAKIQRNEPEKTGNEYFRRAKAWPPPRADVYITLHTSETRMTAADNAFRFKNSVRKKERKKILENYAGIINRSALNHDAGFAGIFNRTHSPNVWNKHSQTSGATPRPQNCICGAAACSQNNVFCAWPVVVKLGYFFFMHSR